MNRTIEINKYHALGNSYLVIDPNKNKVLLAGKKIQTLCRRSFGIGADGILYGPILEDGGFKVRIFNADGSETKTSGNGMAIFAKYLKDAGYVEGLECDIITEKATIHVDLLNHRGTQVRVQMGKATFASSEIPVVGDNREIINEPFVFGDETYNASCVSVGNPHCIIMMDQVSKDIVKKIGPYVENHKDFPRRMNLEICRVIDRNEIEIEIYERGSGYTLASGTGSCAAAVVANRLGLTKPIVNVGQPGGYTEVDIEEDGSISMICSVNFVADLSVAEEFFS